MHHISYETMMPPGNSIAMMQLTMADSRQESPSILSRKSPLEAAELFRLAVR